MNYYLFNASRFRLMKPIFSLFSIEAMLQRLRQHGKRGRKDGVKVGMPVRKSYWPQQFCPNTCEDMQLCIVRSRICDLAK